MNKERRKALAEIVDQLAGIRSAIEQVKDDEQDAFDNMPEGLQQSEKGEKAENAISRLDDALSAVDDIESALIEASE